MSGRSRRRPTSSILGAGVMGASIAFHLARRKAGRILVLDKGDVARRRQRPLLGARADALQLPARGGPRGQEPRDLPELEGLRRARRRLPADRLRAHRPGERPAAPREERRDAARPRRGRAGRRRARSSREIVPDWNVDDVPLAAWEPGSGYGDGAGVANDFLERAREMGVTYRSQTRATGFRRRRRPRHRRRHGPRRSRRARRRRGDGALEPAALCRGRLRPAGRGRVPRGRDPEEPGRAFRASARPASTASRRRTSGPRSAA